MRSALRREVGLATILSAVAGYLDAIGFIVLGGQFVSFISGNTTELATFLGTGDFAGVGLVALLITMFFLGVIIGAIAARFGDSRTTVLTVTTGLLAATAAATLVVAPRTAVMVGLPTAMGAINATFLRQGEVSIGLTYMTGTLVKAGQQVVDAFVGGPRWGWVRNLLLWAALAFGGLLGAVAHQLLGPSIAIWISVGVVLAVTVVVATVRRRTGRWQDGGAVQRYRETPVLGAADERDEIS